MIYSTQTQTATAQDLLPGAARTVRRTRLYRIRYSVPLAQLALEVGPRGTPTLLLSVSQIVTKDSSTEKHTFGFAHRRTPHGRAAGGLERVESVAMIEQSLRLSILYMMMIIIITSTRPSGLLRAESLPGRGIRRSGTGCDHKRYAIYRLVASSRGRVCFRRRRLVCFRSVVFTGRDKKHNVGERSV